MSNPNAKPGLLKRILYMLTLPVRSLFGSLAELWGSLRELGLVRLPFLGRRGRNREFEKAGKEPRRVERRRATDAAFRKGERQRRRELMEAERENRKYLSGNSAEAVEYREQLEQQNVEFSRGDTVNHLAKVNAKHRKQKPEAEPKE